MKYETYERPSMVVPYKVGPYSIDKGNAVGLDEEGLAVPIDKARCFVGFANESRPAESIINVTCCGSFVLIAKWEPTFRDLNKRAYFVGPFHVALEGEIHAGRIVGLESASGGEKGVRIKIDGAVENAQ